MWTPKTAPHPLDTMPIEGGYFLDGDTFAAKLLKRDPERDWANEFKGLKYPMVKFPSKFVFELFANFTVHLAGEMDLSYFDTRDNAWEHANYVAECCGYIAYKEGGNQLVVHAEGQRLIITYDNERGIMINVERKAKTS